MNSEVHIILNSIGVPLLDRPLIGRVEWKSNDIFNINHSVLISWNDSVIISNHINEKDANEIVIDCTSPGQLTNKESIEKIKKIQELISYCNAVPHPSWVIQKKVNNKMKMGR